MQTESADNNALGHYVHSAYMQFMQYVLYGIQRQLDCIATAIS